MIATLCLAIAKTLGIFILLSHLPKKILDFFALKHPFVADLFCMLVIPLPMIIFGGVKATAAAVYFALMMSIAIRLYRMHHERPVQERIKARFVRFTASDKDLRRTGWSENKILVACYVAGVLIGLLTLI